MFSTKASIFSMIIFAAAAVMQLCSPTGVQAGEVLDRVMEKKVLVVATASSWPPQSFMNENNEMDGFDVDVARAIAEKLNVTLEVVTPAWDLMTAGNWAGRWDLSVGSMTPTAARAKVLSFPAVYYYTPASFAVHTDSPIKDKSELNGLRIGTQGPSTWSAYLQKDLTLDAEGTPAFTYDVSTDKMQLYGDSGAVLDDMRLGPGVRLDGILGSLPSLLEAEKAGYPVRVVGTPAFFEPLAIAIDRGDPEFNDKLAQIVDGLKQDGTLTKLSMKWYGVDYTKVE